MHREYASPLRLGPEEEEPMHLWVKGSPHPSPPAHREALNGWAYTPGQQLLRWLLWKVGSVRHFLLVSLHSENNILALIRTDRDASFVHILFFTDNEICDRID